MKTGCGSCSGFGKKKSSHRRRKLNDYQKFMSKKLDSIYKKHKGISRKKAFKQAVSEWNRAK